MTMDSFLQTLDAESTTEFSPAPSVAAAPLLPSFHPQSFSPLVAATTTTEHAYASFSTLESPTPSLLHSSSTLESPTPSLLHSSSSSNRRCTSSTPPYEPTTPTQSSFAPQLYTTPHSTRDNRLRKFDSDRVEPSATTQRNHSSGLVVAAVGGMGRVIISRNILVETLGAKTTEQVISAAAITPTPTLFGQLHTTSAPGQLNNQAPRLADSLPILENFSDRSRFVRKDEPAPPLPLIVDERMQSIRQWLDSPEMVEEEDSRDSWSFIPREWEKELEADSVQRGRASSVVSDAGIEEGREEGREEIRVGGKGVKLLLRSKRRRVEATAEDVDYQKVAPATPTMKKARPTFAGPILVETHYTPQSRSSFYRTAQPDMALAPSPQRAPRHPLPSIAMSSPSRQSGSSAFAPANTEASSSAPRYLPLPVTPKCGRELRTDYSPRSPLFYRSGRSRAISGQFDESLLSVAPPHWTTTDELSQGTTGHFLAPLENDDFHPKSWDDLTSTPSRSYQRPSRIRFEREHEGWSHEA